MKRILSIFLVSAILVATISSCKKKKSDGGSTTNNDVTMTITQEGVRMLDSAVPPLPWSLPIEWKDTLDSQVDVTLAGQGVHKEQIKAAYAKGMTIDLVGSGQTFNFIKDSVRIYVDKVGGTNPVLIASKYVIPTNVTSLSFDVISTDIKDFFTSDMREMTLKFKSKENQGMLAGTEIHYKMIFEVTYTP